MNNLTDLLEALVTIPVRYHHSEHILSNNIPADIDWTRVSIQNPNSIVQELLAKTNDEFMLSLTTLIDESTQHNSKRKPLLMYLQHTIKLLNESIQTMKLHPAEHDNQSRLMQPAITTLLNHLNTLFTQSISVTYENDTVLIDSFSSGSKMARHIKDLIMDPLNITKTTHANTITLQVKCLFLEQIIVFATEENTKKIQRLLDANTALKQEKEDLLDENVSLKQEIMEMRTRANTQQNIKISSQNHDEPASIPKVKDGAGHSILSFFLPSDSEENATNTHSTVQNHVPNLDYW